MRSVKFWRMRIQQLSFMEKMFFKDMIKSLLSWDELKKEVSELDLILKILESEIKLSESNLSEVRTEIRDKKIPDGMKSNDVGVSVNSLERMGLSLRGEGTFRR
jgi:uncharacterized coiled-coil DUF342 family protein